MLVFFNELSKYNNISVSLVNVNLPFAFLPRHDFCAGNKWNENERNEIKYIHVSCLYTYNQACMFALYLI